MPKALIMAAADYGPPDRLAAYEVDVPEPGAGEVTIDVRACGVNPVDFKRVAGYRGRDGRDLPLAVGHEVAGVLSAIGPGTSIASGSGALGDRVVAFRVSGGYASCITVPAADVFEMPEALGFAEGANLLLAGTTASDMLRMVRPERAGTVLIHGASSAVGVSLLQQLARYRVRAVGTASPANSELVRRFGGEAIPYGPGLAGRLGEISPGGFDAAYDCVGSDEAVDVSLALVGPERLVTIAAADRAERDGFAAVGGAGKESAAFRNSMRGELLTMAGEGALVVPMSRTFPLSQAAEALSFLALGHPGGKVALIP